MTTSASCLAVAAPIDLPHRESLSSPVRHLVEVPAERLRAHFRPSPGPEVMERMRSIVDLALEQLAVPGRPFGRAEDPSETRRHFAASLPEHGYDLAESIAHLREHAIPLCRNKRAPTFLAHIDFSPTDISAFSGLLTRALQEDTGTFDSARAGSFIEGQVMRWLCELAFGVSERSEGVATVGGTQATHQAFLLLRGATLAAHGQDVAQLGMTEALRRIDARGLRIFAPAHCHPCVRDTARYLGLGTEGVVSIPSDRHHCMDVGALRRALRESRAAGYLPMAVVLTAGTPGAGAIDPLIEGAAIAREHGAFVHVDAAHGGLLLLSQRWRGRLAGIEQADTVVVDPHKLLGLSQGLGALLVKDRVLLRHVGKASLPYFVENEANDRGLYSMDGSRALNALGAWLLLRTMGRAGYASLIDYVIELSSLFYDEIERCSYFETVTQRPQVNVVLFRRRPLRGSSVAQESARNAALLQAVRSRGEVVMSSYQCGDGTLVLRAVFSNPATDPSHVINAVKHLEAIARESPDLLS